MNELAGKVAVVTGAASGIGLALVRRFAAEGMRVVLADVEPGPLHEAEGKLAADHGADNVLAVATDVRHPAAVHDLAQATFARFGTAHVLCNNAGIATGGFTWDVDPARWRWIVDVNLLGVANGIRAFVPKMIEQGEGHVVNTASAAGLLTGPGMSPYFATKHAVVALSESLHFDLHLTGNTEVGVSVLCPEWVRTRIAESERNRPDEVEPEPEDAPLSEAARQAVMGLVEGGIEPSDVADAVVEAIKVGRFWVLTHPTTLSLAKQRWAAIEADGQPTMWMPV
ncbi:MAG: SDR family NAD(P)-dependent oxidoreductase [Acidimicrobiales bacterium]